MVLVSGAIGGDLNGNSNNDTIMGMLEKISVNYAQSYGVGEVQMFDNQKEVILTSSCWKAIRRYFNQDNSLSNFVLSAINISSLIWILHQLKLFIFLTSWVPYCFLDNCSQSKNILQKITPLFAWYKLCIPTNSHYGWIIYWRKKNICRYTQKEVLDKKQKY